jgi:hypothetical protein
MVVYPLLRPKVAPGNEVRVGNTAGSARMCFTTRDCVEVFRGGALWALLRSETEWELAVLLAEDVVGLARS